MEQLASWDAQVLVYQALSSNVDLLASCNGVFDGQAPSTVVPPYVVLGEISETNNDLLSRIGREVTVLIHVWTRGLPANKEMALLIKKVAAVLSRNSSIEGNSTSDWHVNTCSLESSQFLNDPFGDRHGLARFRLRLEAKIVP